MLRAVRVVVAGDPVEGAGYCYAGRLLVLAVYCLFAAVGIAYGEPARTISPDVRSDVCYLRPSIFWVKSQERFTLFSYDRPTPKMFAAEGRLVTLFWRAPEGVEKPYGLRCPPLWPACRLSGKLHCEPSKTGGWRIELSIPGECWRADALFRSLEYADCVGRGMSLELVPFGECLGEPQLGVLLFNPTAFPSPLLPSDRWRLAVRF